MTTIEKIQREIIESHHAKFQRNVFLLSSLLGKVKALKAIIEADMPVTLGLADELIRDVEFLIKENKKHSETNQ